MKKRLQFLLLLFCFFSINSNAQVVLNELSFGGFLGDFVELKNLGPNTVDVSDYWLFTTVPNGAPSSVQLSALNLACGTLVMESGDIIVFDDVSDFIAWQPDLGDVGLYSTDANDFEFPGDIVDYVAWGLAPLNTITQMVAVAANQWTNGDFANGNYNGLSIEYDGDGNASSDWPFNNMPTICAENVSVGVNCDVSAGTPNIGQFEFCVGDGNADVPTGLTVSGNVGTFFQWVVTDVSGTILELPDSPEVANFENAPGGLCVMWHVAYESNITGLTEGGAILMLGGCHEVSVPVLIVRTEVSGGTIEGGPFEFCVGDAEPDFVSGIILTDNIGTNSQWVVTDEQGVILALPGDPSQVDFNLAPAGTCLIWNLSFEPGLTGAAIGNNAADLNGCFSLSNPITVNRFAPNSPECGGTSQGNYVVVSFDDLKLERATVYSGGLGATDGDLEITEDSDVTADGTFVNGPYVRVYGGARASNINAIAAQPVLPDFQFNNTNTTDDQDVDVNENEVVVLTESVYEDLDIADGATVTFSGQEFVFIEELDIEDNVTILFDQCTNLVIDKKMSIGKYNSFNPGEQNVFIFVEEEVEVKKGSFVYAGIYSLEEMRIRKADEDMPTELYGIFIAEDFKARDYVGLWSVDIMPCEASVTGANPNGMVQQDEEEIENVEVLLNNETFSVFPNPVKDIAYLSLTTGEEQVTQIQVFNMANQLVFEKSAQFGNGHSIAIDVTSFPVGLYTTKIIQHDGTVLSEKLLVAR